MSQNNEQSVHDVSNEEIVMKSPEGGKKSPLLQRVLQVFKTTGFKLLVFMLGILAADFISKGLVNFYIQPMDVAPRFFPFGGISVFKDFYGIDFCIQHVTNRGAAWGIGSGEQTLFLKVS